MKQYLIVISTFFLLSCDSSIDTDEPNKNFDDQIDTFLTAPEDTSKIAPLEAVQENPLTIEDIPKKWYKLDPKKDESGDLVVNDYCEYESEQLNIEYQEQHGWRVLAMYGQDGMWYKVVEFEAYEEVIDGNEVIYGTFILENPYYPDSDVELYDFRWNKDLKFGTFNGFFEDETKMVSELNKDSYEWIEENCDYLDEEP